MYLKKGVKTLGIKPELLFALQVADSVWDDYEEELWVTSLTEGKHGVGSLHPMGMAADLRTRYFTDQQKLLVASELRNRLGEDYDIVVETTHIHIEYHPKS